MFVDNVPPKIASPPVVKPRVLPAASWDATFFPGTGCTGAQTESFEGSGNGCHLVRDLLQPPIHAQPEYQSVLLQAEFAEWDFIFYPNQNCEVTGILNQVFPVPSGQSICVNVSDPDSFDVSLVTAATKRSSVETLEDKRSAVAVLPRGPGPETIWNLTTFGGQQCDGSLIQNFHGSGSSDCEVISGQVSTGAPGGLSIPLSIETGSVLAQGIFAEYAFTFYANEQCQVGGTLEQVYEVEDERCISLGTLDPESFKVEFVKGELKK